MGSNNISKVELIKKGRKHINTKRSVPEVFDVIREAETNEEKIALLQAYDSKAMRFIVNGMYNVDWSDLKIPKHKKNHKPSDISEASIGTSITRLQSAYKHRNSNPETSERNLIRVLEDVSAAESELLVDMIKGRKVKGISKNVFRRSFPSIVPTPTDAESDSPSSNAQGKNQEEA